jgi:tetratricopeptide (TPR) repeat protein
VADETLSSVDEQADDARPDRRFRDRLGDRYVLIDQVGAGGAGVVHQAFDRKLERRVAIKLLKTPEASGASSTRLRREAQANALLQHPNVVSIFDVGEHDGEVFVAMEYASGGSLKAWLAQPRSQLDILRVFRDAGAGLLAAHEKGVVHRDFKPSNVLMGADGRARVADFGLARALARGDDPESGPTSGGLVDIALTRTGAVHGTPAYMAPEQFEGGSVDVRADQFSFCLALAEALTRTSAPRETTTASRNAPEPWDARAWLAGHKMPSRLRQALLRGLSRDRDDRFDSLDPILDALDGAIRPRSRSRVWTVAAAGLVATAATVVLATQWERPCTGLEENLLGTWGERRRAALADAMPAGWEPVWTSIDRWAARWVEARTRVCTATHHRGEQSGELLDARMSCLDRRLDGLRALTSLVELDRVADPNRAVEAVARLPHPSSCLEVERADSMPDAASAEQKAAIQRLQPDLRELEALLAAGLFTEGLKRAESLVERAGGSADDRTQAQALALLARFQQSLDRLDEARDSWHRAAVFAEAAHDDVTRFESLLGMIRMDSGTVEEVARSDRNVERADAIIRRHRWGPRRQAALDAALAQLMTRRGQFDACRRHGERAVSLLNAATGPTPFERIEALEALGNCLNPLGARQEAARAFGEALDAAVVELGPDHPRVGRLHGGLSTAYDFSGNREGAERSARRALEIAMKTLGPKHSDVADAHHRLAILAWRRADFEEALKQFRRSRDIEVEIHGPDSRNVALADSAIGVCLMRMERFDEGIAAHRRAIDGLARVLGPRHPETGAARGRLGSALDDVGAHREAVRECAAAREILEEADPAHVRILDTIRCSASAYLALGRYREALGPLLRGLEIGEDRDETPFLRAWLEFRAAIALAETGSRRRARALARTALQRVEADDRHRDFAREIEAWLRASREERVAVQR